MGAWNVELFGGEPTLQVLFHALLGMKAHRIEGAFFVTDGKRMFRIAQIVLRLLDLLLNPSGQITRLGHRGPALRVPQDAKPTRSDDEPVQTPLESPQ